MTKLLTFVNLEIEGQRDFLKTSVEEPPRLRAQLYPYPSVPRRLLCVRSTEMT